MKKVLFFIESLAKGGAEKVLSDIVKGIDKNKFDITVLTVSDNGVYQDEVKKYCTYKSLLKRSDYNAGGIRKLIYWIKTKYIYSFPSSLVYRTFIKDTYDVEVAFVEGFATKLISSSSNRNSKKIAWVHIDVLHNPHADRWFKHRGEQETAYNQMGKVICVSNTVKESIEKKFSITAEVEVINNPVDTNNIITLSKQTIDRIPHKQLQLVTVGRLEEQKGYLRLLKCVDNTQYKDFCLWILGDGSQRDVLQKYIDDHHLEENVKLLGFDNNPYKYVAKADAFVCSSYAEGYSTAATEAIVLGKPVFTVDCSGMKELFGKHQCGVIVPNTDSDLLMMINKLTSGKYSIDSFKEASEKRALELDFHSNLKTIEKVLYE